MELTDYVDDIINALARGKGVTYFLRPKRRIHLGIIILVLSVILYFLDVSSE